MIAEGELPFACSWTRRRLFEPSSYQSPLQQPAESDAEVDDLVKLFTIAKQDVETMHSAPIYVCVDTQVRQALAIQLKDTCYGC